MIPTYAASDFLDRLGVCTQIAKPNTPYTDEAATIRALQFLGVRHLRDCLQGEAAMASFERIGRATNAKFNLFMAPGAPAWAEASLGYAISFARNTGLAESFEGVNEPDTAYSTGNGNSAGLAAKFQEKVHAAAQGLKIPAIASAYGAGWDRLGGTYGRVGDLSKACEFGNFHAYTTGNQTPANLLRAGLGWARLQTPARDIVLTEWGFHTDGDPGDVNVMPPVVAGVCFWKGLFEAVQLGYRRMYAFELFDEQTPLNPRSENSFGLFWADGTPKPAANLWRNMAGKLAGAPLDKVTPLECTVSGLKPNHGLVALQVTATRYVIAVYDNDLHYLPESGTYPPAAGNQLTLTFPAPVQARRYDPLSGEERGLPQGNTVSLDFSYVPTLYTVDLLGEPTFTAGEIAGLLGRYVASGRKI